MAIPSPGGDQGQVVNTVDAEQTWTGGPDVPNFQDPVDVERYFRNLNSRLNNQ